MDPENDNSSGGHDRLTSASESAVLASVERPATAVETGYETPPSDAYEPPPSDGYELRTNEVGTDTTALLRDPFRQQDTLLPLPLAPSRYVAEERILLRPSVAATLPPPTIEVLPPPSPVLQIEPGPVTNIGSSQLTLAPEVHFANRDGTSTVSSTEVIPSVEIKPAPKPFFAADPAKPLPTIAAVLPSSILAPATASSTAGATVNSASSAANLRVEPVFAPQAPVGERHERYAPPPTIQSKSLGQCLKSAAKFAVYAAAAWLALIAFLIFAYRFVNPPMSSLMLQQWISGQGIQQSWANIEDISPQIVRAVLLSEDGRFCDHTGVDFDAMQDAIERAGDGSPRGASTISMQVTKNLFLWPSKSYVRKAIEIPLTWAMELVWPKRRIMEIYLNIAEWGPGIFGAEAASQFHFQKSARRLNEREAAQLAVALPNPYMRDAGDPGPKTRRLAGDIQARMRNSYASQTSCVLTAGGGR